MHVVSFYAPRPEHPFFQDYTPFLNLLRESCERFGHRHIVLTDDPSVGDDAYVTPLPRSLMKATIAAQLAYLSDPAFADTPTLLTGADCVLAQDPEILASDAITITVDDRFQDCRMNCGAIYIRRPADLAPVWAEALAGMGDEWGDDQRAVYGAIQAATAAFKLTPYEVQCDPANLAPDHPADDCTRGIVLHFRGPRKAWMVDYCHKWLGLGKGITITALPNTNEAAMLANVRINAARDLPWIGSCEPHDGHAVLVGGGPSLADTLPEIRKRAQGGQTIFGLNGAARWLLWKGVWPDHGVILDPRAANAAFITERCKWLIASQCHPSVVDAARDVALWHFPVDGIFDALPVDRRDDAIMIGGGLTVGLTAMGLAFAMGYRKMHLYGYDSSDRDGEGHAYAQAESTAETKRATVWLGPRKFTTNAAMYAQAEAFERWAGLLAENGAIITVHGDGLLPAIAHAMHGATLVQEDMVA